MLVTGSCIALLLTLHCESYVLEETQSTVSDDPPATVKGRIGPQKGKDKTDEQVCFQDVGCFSRRDKLTLPSQFPSDPKFFPPRFLLYDRSVKYLPKTIWLRLNDSFKFRRQFAQKKPLFVVVHGWLESAFVPWAQAIKDALLEQADCNVLVVDWSGLAATTYNNGAANTAAVGRELALVIQRLFKMFPGTLNPTLVHAIGYSFGAQVSGFFGRNLRRSTRALIARITALDPAGPLFNNTDVSVSSEDAAFVDVIHTSGGYPNQPWQLGLFRPVGHVDFYPNGAKNQPGCLGSALCDHMRAPELFLESLVNKGCRLESQPCPGGFEAFLKNSCGGRAEGGANNGEMGFFSLRAPGRGIQLISTNAGPRGYYCIKKSKQ
ncbi:pancreatic lipase-related protein 2-like isoform X6 [Haemaphysalis longicornis]